MSEKTDIKTDALPDLDDLLQCPVCYEIPTGQIFQCNEGHHVCGRCKVRLDVCPVCRALFFGTRNYAMEELIASIRKLRAFKLGGKITTSSSGSESNTPAEDTTAGSLNDVDNGENDNNSESSSTRRSLRPPEACKGLFRCLCCKSGKAERLPAARLLNHLRYFHAPELLEGQSENGEYVQAWQFPTVPGKIVTAVRVSDMGIFFLVIEISYSSICAWLSMAAAPWVAHEFCYTVTISGNDREAIFSDGVWSVRSCEGSLKKRGHCLTVNGVDARALIAAAAISSKLSVRRAPPDQLAHQTQPRAVLRVATRGNARSDSRTAATHDIHPYLAELQNNIVGRLTREYGSLFHTEAESPLRFEIHSRTNQPMASESPQVAAIEVVVGQQASAQNSSNAVQDVDLRSTSLSARRRLRNRLLAALHVTESPSAPTQQSSNAVQTQNSAVVNNHVEHRVGVITGQQQRVPSVTSQRRNAQPQRQNNVQNILLTSSVSQNANRQSADASQRQTVQNNPVQLASSMASVQHRQIQSSETVSIPLTAGPSNEQPQNTNRSRRNKKKRRQKHRR